MDSSKAWSTGQKWTVELRIDGKPIPVKGFVQDFLGAAVEGMVSTLKGIPPLYREITVTIKSAE